ncbi:hypothetical protein [Sphingobium ummariense]|uniref:hypothetical protein n=1 Tax=Sphingobium ummariense TaxID=420994 RepID=UPI00126964BA|nr:hypothetical protein [Sphingobium ummariense]
MRTIEISTNVFAKIWANRIEGEESENQILQRLLGVHEASLSASAVKPKVTIPKSEHKILWRDDVRSALLELGGAGYLRDIYDQVRKIRLSAGRSLPVNTHAIIRRELEYNSSDASAFTGERDWFQTVDGIGGGKWALRKDAQK